jgi:VWFA-related protein
VTRRATLIVAATALAAAAITARTADAQGVILRARQEMVSVDVSVQRDGRAVRGLSPADFRVYDNDLPQRVASMSIEAVPIDVTVLLDTSGSVAALRAGLQRDVTRMAALLHPGDRIRLLTFGYGVEQSIAWRAPGDAFTIAVPPVGRVSAIYDALSVALMRRPEPGRRHLIVALTDGQDWSSVTTSAQLLNIAARADSVLHVVLLAPDSTNTRVPGQWSAARPDANGIERLREAAIRTGGRFEPTPVPGARVVDAFRRAYDDFRQSYVLHYSHSGPDASTAAADGWHVIRVEVARPGEYAIRAKKGYFGG